MPEITINDTSVTDEVCFVDRLNEVIHQHGGLCTRIKYSDIEEMSIDEFKERVVPTLKASDTELVVVRNAASGTYACILGDRVIRYNVRDVGECALEDLAAELMANAQQDIQLNIPLPVIRYFVANECTKVTVLVPSSPRRINYLGTKVKVWLPPLWFNVTLNASLHVMNRRLCVAPAWSADWQKTELFKWPLGNVHENGDVCVGSSVQMTNIDNRTVTLADKVIMEIDRVFGAEFNNDLLYGISGSSFDTTVAKVYKERSAVGLIKRDVKAARNGVSTVERVLSIWSMPDGWTSLTYPKVGTNAVRFTE